MQGNAFRIKTIYQYLLKNAQVWNRIKLGQVNDLEQINDYEGRVDHDNLPAGTGIWTIACEQL